MHRYLRARIRFLLWILAAAILPPATVLGLTYLNDIHNARTELRAAVLQGKQQVEQLLRLADELLAELADEVAHDDPDLAARLQRVAYEHAVIREAGVVDEDGRLVLTSLGRVEPPIPVPAEHRANPTSSEVQILGPLKTAVMKERSLLFSLPTTGQGEVNLVVDPRLLTRTWGCEAQTDLGPGGFVAFLDPGTGRVLAAVGRPQWPVLTDPEAPPAPGRLRTAQLAGDGEVLVVAETNRAWVLRSWRQDLHFGAPLGGLVGALIMALVARAAWRSQGLDHELRVGLANNELRVHYQPIVDIATRHCIGSEALVRWYHPQNGVLTPNLFLPAAERTGLIHAIGATVLRQVCSEHRELFKRLPDLYVAINLSPAQLHSADLGQMILWLQDRPRCAAHHFVVELTEDALISRPGGYTPDIVARLRALGLRVALDDFGQAYSSLSCLHQLDIDVLKIDRHYVDAIGKSEPLTGILDSIIDLGHKLGLTMVAEGIETEAQLRYLAERGVTRGQGWLFSRPLPFAELARCIDRQLPLRPPSTRPAAGSSNAAASD